MVKRDVGRGTPTNAIIKIVQVRETVLERETNSSISYNKDLHWRKDNYFRDEAWKSNYMRGLNSPHNFFKKCLQTNV